MFVFHLGRLPFWSSSILVSSFWSSSFWVEIGLHAENQLPGWSGSGLKVTGGGWVGYNTHNVDKPTSTWWGGLRLESIHSLTFGNNHKEEVGNVYLGNFKQ